MKNTLLRLVILISVASPAFSEDVWVLQGFATSPIPGTILSYRWTGDVLFHNASPNETAIRLIDLSNGGPPTSANRTLLLGAGRSASAPGAWRADASLWVAHLDVPPNVIIESRIRIGEMLNPIGQPVSDGSRGKLSFPMFRSLQPAGVAKIHLGTDLEDIPARNNVAVYNAGDVSARAHIEVHQFCDEALLDSRDLDVPAKTVIQAGGMIAATNCASHYTYVAVTVDQPSLSWVSSLANVDQIKVLYAATSSSP